MKKISFITICFLGIVCTFLSCRKSYSPGDWSVLPEYPVKEDIYTGPTKTLKIMSVNMNLSTNAANFPAMVTMIKAYNPDLLLLRQCDSKTTRANGIDRPKVIADELGMEFFMAGRDYNNGKFGNAVLSKLPVSETFGLDLTKDPGRGEQRTLAMIKVEVDEGQFVYFAGTEIETNEDDRRSQAIDILRATQDLVDPVILAGNFNEQQRSPGAGLTYIGGSFTFACPVSGCSFTAPKALLTGTYEYVTYQDPDKMIILGRALEAFKSPETANTFYPGVAELKIKIKE